MASVNQATIIGFVGEAPRVNTTSSGWHVATIAVATTERGYKKRDGTEVPDRTDWHNVVLWGRLADVAQQFVRKGSLVYVQGKLHTRAYDDKQGIKRYITEIECETIQLLDKKNGENQSTSTANNINVGMNDELFPI